jgi:hypothetical protein
MRHVLAFLGLTVAFAGATALSLVSSEPVATHGYSTLGHNLSTNNRDFRVNNNFSDGTANNNVTPHYNYPGQTGAVMAIWKGHSEWNSRGHGDGAGDPVGNNFIGSGQANLDFIFNGTTNSTGGFNHAHRVLSGGSGSTLAYMTGGSSWHIRYYETWVWQDGPGGISTGQDIQAVACHEVGHALGLGHSGDGQATMFPSIGAGSEKERSINADDKAGLQAIYGAMSATKPNIFTLSGSTQIGGVLIIDGENFSNSNNEVWFTNTADTQTPTKVTGLPSTAGGTHIEVVIPPTAADGDMLVKKSGSGHSTVSQTKPIDIGAATGDPPFILAVTPDSGPNAGYHVVTISGQGFIGVDTVRFGDTDAINFSVESANLILATTPPGTLGEQVGVTVVDEDGQSTLNLGYEYSFNQQIAVDSISPSTGPASGGTVVTISGDNVVPIFGVLFEATSGTDIQIISANEFTVVTPAHVPGTVDVVADGFGFDTLDSAFTFEGDGAFVDLGPGIAGALGQPLLAGAGDLTPGSGGGFVLDLSNAAPNAFGLWWISLSEGSNTLLGGQLYPSIPFLAQVPFFASGAGSLSIPGSIPVGGDGLMIVMQMWLDDPSAPFGASATNGLRLDVP